MEWRMEDEAVLSRIIKKSSIYILYVHDVHTYFADGENKD